MGCGLGLGEGVGGVSPVKVAVEWNFRPALAYPPRPAPAPPLRYFVPGWSFLLPLLLLAGGCQSPKPASPITASNYFDLMPDPRTLSETYVNDPNTLLTPSTVAALNARLDRLGRAGRTYIDVVLVRSLGEAVPKTAAYELFNKWKVGSEAPDNGLPLVVVDQHHIAFETGYGLAGELPDAICYRIQQPMLAPAITTKPCGGE